MNDTAAPAKSAALGIAGAILRHALTAASTALVTHRYIDQTTATDAVGPISDYVLGAGVAIGSAAWGVFRARASHWRWVQAWTAPARALPPA